MGDFASEDFFATEGDYVDPQNCDLATISNDDTFVTDLANAMLGSQDFVNAIISNPKFLSAVLSSDAFTTNLGQSPTFVQKMVDDGNLTTLITKNAVMLSAIAQALLGSNNALIELQNAQDPSVWASYAQHLESSEQYLRGILSEMKIDLTLIADDGSTVAQATETLLPDGQTYEYTFDATVADGNPLTKLRVGFTGA